MLGLQASVTMLSEIITLERGSILFWHVVLGVSVHGWLTLLFWAYGESEHNGGSVWQRKTVHIMIRSEQEAGGGRLGSQYPLLGHIPNSWKTSH
jgi:hypothetical protein